MMTRTESNWKFPKRTVQRMVQPRIMHCRLDRLSSTKTAPFDMELLFTFHTKEFMIRGGGLLHFNESSSYNLSLRILHQTDIQANSETHRTSKNGTSAHHALPASDSSG